MLLPVTADARLGLLVLLLASSAMPLGSTEEHLDLYLGRDNRDNQPVAQCQIHSHVSTRHQAPPYLPLAPLPAPPDVWECSSLQSQGQEL